MASGYIEYHDNTGTEINAAPGTYVGVAMTTSSVPNANDAIPLPTSGCRWSHCEVTITSNHTTEPSSINVFLAWNSNGQEIIAGPSTALTLQEQTANTFSCAFDLGIVPTYPSSTTAPSSGAKARGTVYLFLRADAVSGAGGDADKTRIKIARLHWHELSKG
jgi:hypothetical protein